jgi:hypothetical protein
MGNTVCRGALCSVLLTNYYLGDQIKKEEMGRACSMYGEGSGPYRVVAAETRGKETTWKSQA